MPIILDKSTLTDDEIKKVIKKIGATGVIIYERPDDIIDFWLDVIDLTSNNRFNILFVTRGTDNVRCKTSDGLFIVPPLIRVVDEISHWKKSEQFVDAKVKSIDDFLDRKFTVLIGEAFSYNNLRDVGHLDLEIYQEEEEITELSNRIIKTISTGRYFPTKFRKNNLEVFPQRIVKCKDEIFHANSFFGTLFKALKEQLFPDFDEFCYIPTKEGKIDRFKGFIGDNLLELVNDYGSIRELTRDEKLEVMDGAFKSSRSLIGKKVVLVDDVKTSNATLVCASKALFDAGAKEVVWLTFARTFREIEHGIRYACSSCGEPLIVRFNSSNLEWFVGCSGFTKPQKCTRVSFKRDMNTSLNYIFEK